MTREALFRGGGCDRVSRLPALAAGEPGALSRVP